MTTRMLFRDDAYARQATSVVAAITEDGGIVVEATVFYPTGGGQPGDSGDIAWNGETARIATTVQGPDSQIVLLPETGAPLPDPGQEIVMHLDWDRRYSLMRVHTALHLLSVAIPFGVTGGAISEGKGRLDFDMEDPVDKEAVGAALQALVAEDHPVSCRWISDAELDAQPELVRQNKRHHNHDGVQYDQ